MHVGVHPKVRDGVWEVASGGGATCPSACIWELPGTGRRVPTRARGREGWQEARKGAAQPGEDHPTGRERRLPGQTLMGNVRSGEAELGEPLVGPAGDGRLGITPDLPHSVGHLKEVNEKPPRIRGFSGWARQDSNL
jgi:hypothetical protein